MNAALVRAFLGRFFENEITGGSNDLRQSFFWLISFLAAPGIGMPILMTYQWGYVVYFGGPAILELVTRADKVFYLGFAMIGPAIVCAFVWNSLLLDARDGFVLGVLPVRPRAVVTAKLAALGVYVAIISIGMHAVSSLAWGLILASESSFAFAFRGVAAHFLTSVAASVFAVAAIAGVQGAALALFGPRVFSRVSPLLQLGLVLAIGAGMFVLPTVSTGIVQTLRGVWHVAYPPARFHTFSVADFIDLRTPARPWILRTPPAWFLGLYEWFLGVRDPSVGPLAAKAAAALAGAVLLVIGSYGFAYRRLMVRLVEEGAGFRRVGRLAGLARIATRLVVWRPRSRALVEFLLITTVRVDRHRFAVAAGLGAALAWSLPTVSRWVGRWPLVPPTPQVDLLALPLSLMVVVLIVLRISAALPSDLKAAWVFDESPPSHREVRSVMERLLFTAGVLPFVFGFLPLHWWLWGARVAWTHVAFAIALGWLMIQMLMRHFYGVPCASPWRPERADLRFRGPIYLVLFLWFAAGMYFAPRPDAALELGALQFTPVLVFSLVIFLAPAIVLRWNATHEPPPPPEEEVLGVVSVLHLE